MWFAVSGGSAVSAGAGPGPGPRTECPKHIVKIKSLNDKVYDLEQNDGALRDKFKKLAVSNDELVAYSKQVEEANSRLQFDVDWYAEDNQEKEAELQMARDAHDAKKRDLLRFEKSANSSQASGVLPDAQAAAEEGAVAPGLASGFWERIVS